MFHVLMVLFISLIVSFSVVNPFNLVVTSVLMLVKLLFSWLLASLRLLLTLSVKSVVVLFTFLLSSSTDWSTFAETAASCVVVLLFKSPNKRVMSTL